MEGRQIIDVVFVAYKDVPSILRSNIRDILCKLDIRESYDHVY